MAKIRESVRMSVRVLAESMVFVWEEDDLESTDGRVSISRRGGGAGTGELIREPAVVNHKRDQQLSNFGRGKQHTTHEERVLEFLPRATSNLALKKSKEREEIDAVVQFAAGSSDSVSFWRHHTIRYSH